ncbi:hypothetical protein ACA910_016557 [Epithemia clementina (nom. ined.)]
MKLHWNLAGASLLAVVDGAGIGNFFTYYDAGGLGPDRWPFLDMEGNECGGMGGATGYGQSPVTISQAVESTCDTDKAAYSFTGGDCTWNDLKFSLSNNGAKVEPKVNDDGTTCNFGSMNIPHTPNKFNALQFHIHTYSEHEIEGKGDRGFFPAELHVVHQEETKESYAVFGTMIDVGDTAHPVFEYFLRGWELVATNVAESCPVTSAPYAAVQQKVTCSATYQFPYNQSIQDGVAFFPDGGPNLYEDLPTASEWGVYTYKGGLTTPGCNEIVNWNLLDEAMLISQEQMDRLDYLILCFVQPTFASDGTTVESCVHNTVASESGSTSRPPQPLLGRKVTHRCPKGPAVVISDVGVLPPPDQDFVKPSPIEEPANTGSNKCTKTLFEDCSDDPRYDPEVSVNLKSTAPSWADAEGYWVGTRRVYNNQGSQLMETFASDKFKNTMPYPQDEVKMFVNRTVMQTRYFAHIYQVFKPASLTFCTFAIPEESSNVLGNGECGKNGYATVGERFGTATFEKDGTVDVFFTTGRYAGGKGKAITVDDDTFYYKIGDDNSFEYSETESFNNPTKTRVAGSGQYFIVSDVLPYSANPLAESFTYELYQVSEETFKEQLAAAYADNNVLPEDQKPVISSGNCIDISSDATCPSEAMFQSVDPLYNSTPYEQDPSVKGGWIAFFVILGVLVLVGILYVWHVHRINQQADRYKHQFARRIAETINMDHDKKLSAKGLEQEFKTIDSDGNGVITKEEFYRFMGDRVSEQDFNVMFAAIDIDHSGSIDFAEFCAFMAQIGAILTEEEERAGHKPSSKALAKDEEAGNEDA